MTATLFSNNMFLSSSHGTCSLSSRNPGERLHRRKYERSPWHLLVASDGESSVSSPTGETLPGWSSRLNCHPVLIVILSAAKDLPGLRLRLPPGRHTGRGNHRVVTDTVILANQVIRSENTRL